MKKILIIQGGTGKLAEAIEDYFLLRGINCIRTTEYYTINKINKNDIALIALAGYKQIIPSFIHKTFPVFNCHPTLLPCGKGLYGEKAINYSIKNKCTGLTIHKVTENIDGGEIIHQEPIKINKNENAIDVIN